MTKEQEEAIEMLEDIENNTWTTRYIMSSDSKKAETVLNMLKENSAEIHQKNTELAEKNAEIEKYKKLLADNLARELNNSIKAKEKADTDLDDLDKGWKVELEKKDKMIDLMAEELQKHIFVLYDGDTITSKKGIIQHYERKAKDYNGIIKEIKNGDEIEAIFKIKQQQILQELIGDESNE